MTDDLDEEIVSNPVSGPALEAQSLKDQFHWLARLAFDNQIDIARRVDPRGVQFESGATDHRRLEAATFQGCRDQANGQGEAFRMRLVAGQERVERLPQLTLRHPQPPVHTPCVCGTLAVTAGRP